MEKINEIVTHGGQFHADDTFATACLNLVSRRRTATIGRPEGVVPAELIRTRDPRLLAPKEGRVVVDVGGVYDPSKNLFDHHQREGRRPPRESGIPYAGFGLIWEHYGRELCRATSAEEVEEIHQLVDCTLVCGVDAADNGMALTELKEEFRELRPGLGLSAAIAALNPSWLDDAGEEAAMAAFGKAVDIATDLLKAQIRYAQGTVFARANTREALKRRVRPELLVLKTFHPWQEEAIKDAQVLYCLFPSEEGTWMVQAIPPALGSFEKRKPLPSSWAGLRGKDLASLTGVADAIFCHPGQFICGAATREGALRLAELALAE